MSEYIATTDPDEPIANARNGRSAVAPIRPTDGERLMRFWRHRDQGAFAEVVEIHAPLVWGVCSQVLRRREDVEDAFQATFLILARKAKSIRAADSAAGWLYRVAFRTALLARNRRLRLAEQPLVDEPASDDDQLDSIARHEQCLVLLEELHALPMQYRQPLVLCYLEGRSRSEAADELGLTPQSVKGRLARGTRMLRTRLVSRGAALSTAMAATTAAMASAPALAAPAMAASTAGLAASFAMKLMFGSIGGAVKSSAAVTLAEKGILAMTLAAAAKPGAVVLAVCLMTGLWAVAAEKPAGEFTAPLAGAVLLAETAEPAAAAAEAKAAEEPVDVQPSDPAAVPAEPPLVQPPLPTPAAPLAAPPTYMPMPHNPYPEPRMAISEPVQRSADPSETPNETAEIHAVELEMESWDLKAEWLEKKVHALALKAKRLKASGQATGTEILEAEAEAALTYAEVLLCQSNSIRLKDTIRQLESRHAKRHASSSLAPLQPAFPQPAPAPAVVGNPLYYGTPAQPVPAAWNPTPAAAQPWTPQPAAAMPVPPALMPDGRSRDNDALTTVMELWRDKMLEVRDGGDVAAAEEQVLRKLYYMLREGAAAPPADRPTRPTSAAIPWTPPSNPPTTTYADPRLVGPQAPMAVQPNGAHVPAVEVGGVLISDQAARAFNAAMRRLQDDNEKLLKRLDELEKNHGTQ